jgi:hypothetical protein
MVVRRCVECSVLPQSLRRPFERTSSTQANSASSEDQRSPQTSWFRAHSPYCKLTTIASRRARIGSRPSARASIWARIADRLGEERPGRHERPVAPWAGLIAGATGAQRAAHVAARLRREAAPVGVDLAHQV